MNVKLICYKSSGQYCIKNQKIALNTKKKHTSNEVAQPSCMGNIEFCINKCSYSTTLDKGNAH